MLRLPVTALTVCSLMQGKQATIHDCAAVLVCDLFNSKRQDRYSMVRSLVTALKMENITFGTPLRKRRGLRPGRRLWGSSRVLAFHWGFHVQNFHWHHITAGALAGGAQQQWS